MIDSRKRAKSSGNFHNESFNYNFQLLIHQLFNIRPNEQHLTMLRIYTGGHTIDTQ